MPLSQIGQIEVKMEDLPCVVATARPPLPCAEISPTIFSHRMSVAIMKQLKPIIDTLPPGYRIEMAGQLRNQVVKHTGHGAVVPIMTALTLLIIIVQVRSSFSDGDGLSDRPAGFGRRGSHAAAVQSTFGINALVGLIALAFLCEIR